MSDLWAVLGRGRPSTGVHCSGATDVLLQGDREADAPAHRGAGQPSPGGNPSHFEEANVSHTTDITLLLGSLDDVEALQVFNARLEAAGTPPQRRPVPAEPRLGALGLTRQEILYRLHRRSARWNNVGDEPATLVREFKAFDWASPENAILVIVDEQLGSVIHRPCGH